MAKKKATSKNTHPAGKVHKATTRLSDAGHGRKVGKPASVEQGVNLLPAMQKGEVPLYAPQSPANPTWVNQADRIAEKLKNTRNRE